SKELDATGLYDYGARPYDPGTGRFSQADEVEARGNPQGLNRFSYVLNNPLIMTDPTGHDAKEPQWGWQPGSPTMSPTGIPLGGAEGGPGSGGELVPIVPSRSTVEFDVWFASADAHMTHLLGKKTDVENYWAERAARGAYSSPEFPQLWNRTFGIED